MVDVNGLFSFAEVLAAGLYFTVIGYKFLMFGYFLLIRFRRSKRVYWLYFSLFFIFLAASRVAYMIYDFFLLESDTALRLVAWKLANVTGWFAVAALSGILSVLLFTGEGKVHQAIKKIFPLVPVGLGVHVIFLPADWIVGTGGPFGIAMAKFYLNYVIMPLYIVLLPFMFFYLAKRSVGTLQRSFFLNGLGLLIYYAIRAIQGPILEALMPTSAFIPFLLPPLVILLAIMLIGFANQYEHLK